MGSTIMYIYTLYTVLIPSRYNVHHILHFIIHTTDFNSAVDVRTST